MPNYEYLCEKCKHKFEVIQKLNDLPIEKCPLCNGKVNKLISSPGIMFKGSGWYVTDYSDKYKRKKREEKKTDEIKDGKPTEKGDAIKNTSASTVPSSPSPSSKSPESKTQQDKK